MNININFFYLLFSIAAFFYAPKSYSLLFNILMTCAFLLQTVVFIYRRSNKNYINFYTLFFLSYFFVNFFYASVLYPINEEFLPVFRRPFNHDIINKSTALAWVVSSSFILGASLVKQSKFLSNKQVLPVFNHMAVTVSGCFMFLIFITLVGKDFLNGNFNGQSPLSQYVLPLTVCLFVLAAIIFFRDYKYQTKKYIFYIALLVYLFIFLSIGDRGPALTLITVIIALYTFYIKKVRLILLLPLGFLGVFLMSLIGDGRTSEVVVGNQNIISRGLEDFEFNIENLYLMTHDLSGISWNLYIGVDYVQTNGINWGSTLFGYLLAIIPFLAGMVESAFDIKLQSSAEIFTRIGLGENATWGLGTNLVASVYISFGLAGCALLFFILGMLVEKIHLKTYYNNTVLANIIYFSLIGLAVYYPRTDLLTPLKPIVWTYVIYIILRNTGLLKARFR